MSNMYVLLTAKRFARNIFESMEYSSSRFRCCRPGAASVGKKKSRMASSESLCGASLSFSTMRSWSKAFAGLDRSNSSVTKPLGRASHNRKRLEPRTPDSDHECVVLDGAEVDARERKTPNDATADGVDER